ncbi:MAG: dihydroorotate dehydrogenase electron transfer subunit [Chloroflexota bacterium]|jgi:dihydroorotate dehydrogenase electron transfer subunit
MMTQEHDLAAQSAMLISNKDEGGGCFRLVLVAPQIAAAARPGQFLHIRCGDGNFLRRPISLADADPRSGTVTLLIRRAGRGTDWLAGRHPGERLDVIGPLGNGFPSPTAREWWLVAGGIGWAPLRFLALRGVALGKRVRVFFGARTVTELIGLEDLDPYLCEFTLTTDNGSAGRAGTVIDALPADCAPDTAVFACGPRGMLKALAERLRAYENTPQLYVSLEERMACGVGACLGCAVSTTDGLPKRVCADGPVFAAAEVAL